MPEGRDILIVEDDSLIGWSMARALGTAGYNPVVVDCGEAAVEKIRMGAYECVISDFRLPGMDGLALAGRVKEISASIPVIIISSNEELSPEAVDASRGVDYVIEKPFNLGEIVRLVGDIVEPGSANLINGSGFEK